jgi:hypothetical protein
MLAELVEQFDQRVVETSRDRFETLLQTHGIHVPERFRPYETNRQRTSEPQSKTTIPAKVASQIVE